MSDVPLTLQHLAALQAMIREVSGYAVTIVGGAVRDLLMGKPVKDIDIVVEAERDYEYAETAPRMTLWLLKVAEEMKATAFRVTNANQYPDDDRSYGTAQMEVPGFPTLNFIFTEDEGGFINGFPDTMSQAALDDKGEPVYSDAFHDFKLYNGHVYTRLPLDDERNQRLARKYPDAVFVYSKEQFEDLTQWY